MDRPKSPPHIKLTNALSETFGLSSLVATTVILFVVAICASATVWFVRSIPPREITLASGRTGSSFQRYAENYKRILATHGVKLVVLPSSGSEDNLKLLQQPNSGVDIAFVQMGQSKADDSNELVSLGSIAYQPLWVFYKNSKRITLLSELAGKRIAIGTIGSGTHTLALNILHANGIDSAPTSLLDLDAESAAAGLIEGKVDAVFLMGDSASIQTTRNLVRTTEIHIFSFTQADAYTRKFNYLNRLNLPEGSIDLGQDLPSQDVTLLGPTVELIARPSLNPAISDLLLEVAQEVHGKAGLLQKAGEFPAPLEHGIRISEDAQRFYRSGKGFLYRTIGSFWLASIINRIVVTFLPVAILIVPTVRFFPIVYKWRIQMRFYYYYRRLLEVEQEASMPLTRERESDLLTRLRVIEEAVNRLKVPAAIADQFYALRGHIVFVRERMLSSGNMG